MREGSLIDDVDLELGEPILFTNPEIRRMIRLADPKQDDVFFDLGCGWGQNLIAFASESRIKKCVGIESNESRYVEAKRRVSRWPEHVSSKITIVKGDLFELLKKGYVEEGGVRADLKQATIIFFGLHIERVDIDSIQRWLRTNQQEGCKLLYYFNHLIPEIMPDDVKYPFYRSSFEKRSGRLSFRRPRRTMDWLEAVTQKTKSSIPNKRLTLQELWDELSHDYNVKDTREVVDEYQARLKAILRKR